MKNIQHTGNWSSAGLILMLAGALLLWPVAGLALDTCPESADSICGNTVGDLTGDCDQDGFTDAMECEGFSTSGAVPIDIYGHTDAPTAPGAIKLNPSEPDLMFIASTVAPDSLMSKALESATAQGKTALVIYSDGFKINTYQVKEENCGDDRLITGSVRAAWIRESTSTTAQGGSLGITPSLAVPSDANVGSTIYTQKIANEVNDTFCNNTECSIYADRKTKITDNQGPDGNEPIINYYILQVISHEMGHLSRLAPTEPSTYYHYQRSGTVMDPAITFKRGIYTMPNQFNMAEDPPALTLYDVP